MTEKQRCPRRYDDAAVKDTWRDHVGLAGQKRGCSYCGSMHPDDFMQAIRDGHQVGPTDKSYKAYLSKALTPDELAAHRDNEIARWALDVDLIKATEIVDKHLAETPAHGQSLGKFYFQHLSEDQMREFIDILNAGRMNIGYPGHFYSPPFFFAR